jgi:hypothetical protein
MTDLLDKHRAMEIEPMALCFLRQPALGYGEGSLVADQLPGYSVYDFRSIDRPVFLFEDIHCIAVRINEAASMKERRKKPDRRVQAAKQGLPPYYARGIPDRRRKDKPIKLNQPEEMHIEPATRDLLKEYANSGREQA